jgi:hypothetical protein
MMMKTVSMAGTNESKSASMGAPRSYLEAVEDTAKELHAHEGEDEHDHEHQEEEVRHERQRLAQGHDDYVQALPHVRT